MNHNANIPHISNNHTGSNNTNVIGSYNGNFSNTLINSNNTTLNITLTPDSVIMNHYFELCEAYRRLTDFVIGVQQQNLNLLQQNRELANELKRLQDTRQTQSIQTI